MKNKNYIHSRSHIVTARLIRYRHAFANVLKRAASHLALYIDNNDNSRL